jgi:NAD(P)-dependent dehydrogenase (short-subunit alcohol dehydrogenase family)
MRPPELLGGSSGVGLAVAQAAARALGQVVLLARSEEKLASALDSLPGANHQMLSVDATDVRTLKDRTASLGSVDHLVLSIGSAGPPPTRFAETSLQEARKAFEDHYWAAVHVLHAVHPLLRPQAQSSVTFVTGSISRRPILGKAFTSSYQHALEGLARALVDELAPIRVNTVLPGLVDTPLWSSMPQEIRAAMFAGASLENPVGFVPTAAPIGQAIVDLMANRYVSGAALSVDGGWSLSRRSAAT